MTNFLQFLLVLQFLRQVQLKAIKKAFWLCYVTIRS